MINGHNLSSNVCVCFEQLLQRGGRPTTKIISFSVYFYVYESVSSKNLYSNFNDDWVRLKVPNTK